MDKTMTLRQEELELLIELLGERLETIGTLGDPGERFTCGVLREKLIKAHAGSEKDNGEH